MIAWDVYVDGSGTYHPGSPACIGVALVANGMLIAEISAYVGPGSNNVAELEAIRHGLELLGAVHPLGERGGGIVWSDSTYAIGCAEGHYRVASNHELVWDVAATRRRFPHVELQHVKGHAGNPGNELADWLAGRARKQHLGSLESMRTRVIDHEWLERRADSELAHERLRRRAETVVKELGDREPLRRYASSKT